MLAIIDVDEENGMLDTIDTIHNMRLYGLNII